MITNEDRLKLLNGILCELSLYAEEKNVPRKDKAKVIGIHEISENEFLGATDYYENKNNAFILKPAEDVLLIAGNENVDDGEKLSVQLFINKLEVIKEVVGRRLRLSEEYEVTFKDREALINCSYKNLSTGEDKTNLSINLNKEKVMISYEDKDTLETFDLAIYDKIIKEESEGKNIYKDEYGNKHYLNFICQERGYDRNSIFMVNKNGIEYLNGKNWVRDPDSYKNNNVYEFYDTANDIMKRYVMLDDIVREINNIIPVDSLRIISDYVYGKFEKRSSLRGFLNSIDKNEEYSKVKF